MSTNTHCLTRRGPITSKEPLSKLLRIPDYFKSFVASWINFFGGRIGVFEAVVERGRREALLRMKEDAVKWGARQIVNVRLETAEIGGQASNGVVAVEIIAYGTGVQ